jgi:hypothetical protein
MAATYDAVADLPLRIERYDLEARDRGGPTWVRKTTTVHLHGGGHEGQGEDVTWMPDVQDELRASGLSIDPAGDWTLDSFSEQVAGLADFPRWSLESAALDLALRQSGLSLAKALDREPRPLSFVASVRFEGGDPAPILDRIAAYPGARFKLDPEPDWTVHTISALARTGAVDVLDFKGLYKDTPVDVPTDPELYRACAVAMPGAYLEDPDLSVPEADAALEPHRDRITWDFPIHSVEDAERLPFPPRALNCKPSRFGSVRRLFDFYDYAAERGITLYGGGQAELGVGRGQIQLLAGLFHPDAPNDVAPAGWDQPDWPRTGLPTSPVDPAPESVGFRRRA